VSRAEQHVRAFARSCVRAGLLDDQALLDEVVAAISAELPDRQEQAPALARHWVEEDRAELVRDARSWLGVTDHERLQAALEELAARDIAVLQACEDHWAAKALLDHAGSRPRGVLWFTPPDVWHAVDEGMLEVNLWHGDSANVAPGDPLLDEVVETLQEHGLPAHFDEGRIEVSMRWRRRPSSSR